MCYFPVVRSIYIYMYVCICLYMMMMIVGENEDWFITIASGEMG